VTDRLSAREESGVVFVEGTPGGRLLESSANISLVLEACFSARTRLALLYSSNLTPRFFDVSSREAGDILQKLRSYRLHTAVVKEPGAAPPSRRFHGLLEAERRDGWFDVFDTRAHALEWLASVTREARRT